MNTRRQFLIHAPLGFLVTAAACSNDKSAPASQSTPATGTPGAPPTFGTGAGSGPAITPATFAEAEKLMQVTMTAAERQQAADSWRQSLAQYLERRTGPRKVALTDTDAPATIWNPILPGIAPPPSRDRFVRSKPSGIPLPASDDEIAFAPVTELSRWIESRQLSSERLTQIYLGRIERLDGKIRSVITTTRDHALARAKAADAEIAAGKYRGPLHGVPYGVKDLLDTKGILTTYGAEPFRNRVPTSDSAVVRRLDDAGAVLIAKLSLGALALNDI
jgi:Amidase